jgi:hypothetical protein
MARFVSKLVFMKWEIISILIQRSEGKGINVEIISEGALCLRGLQL